MNLTVEQKKVITILLDNPKIAITDQMDKMLLELRKKGLCQKDRNGKWEISPKGRLAVVYE